MSKTASRAELARVSRKGAVGLSRARLEGRQLSSDPAIKPLAVVGGQPIYPDLSVHQPQTRIERHAPPEESLLGVLTFDRALQPWLALPLKHQAGEPIFLRVYDHDFVERFALEATAPQAGSSDLSWDGKDAQGQALAPGRYSLKVWSSLQTVVREVIVR